jgi:hypothetical protein
MLWGNRRPAPTGARRRKLYSPKCQYLEPRELLAIDLANIAGPVTPPGAGPFGVLEAGGQNGGGAGWSVAAVGDVNGDGLQDFVIGAPSVTLNGNIPQLGNGGNARVYLVFGSSQVPNTTFDWLQLTAQQRVGDLNFLGQPNQTNPLNGNAGFDFNGITFIASQQPSSALGASVAGVGNIDGNGAGISSFMIGAPGADSNNGRAYLIYGGANLSTLAGDTVDLDNLSFTPNINVLTFTNANSAARTGRAVAPAGDVITDGFPDIAIGAPNATISGLSGQGAVYLVSGGFLRPARTATVPLETVGQAGGVPGIIFAGANAGGATGRSVAGVGNTTGATNAAGTPTGDLLIGAPAIGDTGAANGPGAAILVYGASNLASLATTVGGVTFINLANVGTTVPGAIFNGTSVGDKTGWAVSTAADFNGDGLGDFIIGSPGWNSGQGRATIIYGQSVNGPNGAITGTFDIGNLPASVPFAELDGETSDSAAGFSVAAVGPIITAVKSEVLVGTPGFNAGEGSAFLIPANSGLFGIQTLSEGSPVFATQITLSQPVNANNLGSSVSGNLTVTTQNRTADSDTLSDFIIGSSGFNLSTSNPRPLAGGGFMLEGRFIPLQTPVVQQLTSTIGVDAPFAPPFRVNATSPTTLQIFVFSNANSGTPNFVPLRDLNPATTVVNGVAFPGATIAADPVDENNDGLQDAIITIQPRSALNLNSSTTTFTLQARTLATSPNANKTYQSSTSIIVEGAGPGGGGLPTNRIAVLGLANLNAAVPIFGGKLVPTPDSLSHITWKPLPLAVAFNQYLPQNGFGQRLRQFFHPPKRHNFGSKFSDSQYRTSTLGQDVFTRGRFPKGVFSGTIRHKKQPTIPPTQA